MCPRVKIKNFSTTFSPNFVKYLPSLLHMTDRMLLSYDCVVAAVKTKFTSSSLLVGFEQIIVVSRSRTLDPSHPDLLIETVPLTTSLLVTHLRF